MPSKKIIYDEYEAEILDGIEAGEFVPVENPEELTAFMRQAAKNTIKRRPLSIRLPQSDIAQIQARAAEEGVPYQTLIASILHKYNTGKLIERTDRR